ncbi:filament-like plant protein 3 [Silene latifolia]|uniref:filament-like plant protein 3 n=1 Tax=Silene latifolia TaxID=37657 RepID=UPI003D775E9C
MDRRSWLWRRKSSDKSSGETESLGSGSGSISSPSERFSDEQQVYSIKNVQSPEVTSNPGEDTYDSMKILSAKLSAAVATINEKEELVKQHAKVAEEAVTGWEMAENEMNDLKQQLDIATKKNSTLEDKVVHLDGALKECLRQLRQVREEQDQKIQEAISKKSENTESANPELQDQLADISSQLEIANAKAEAAISSESDLLLKLASVEKENAALQLELRARLEELQVMSLERDLSTKRAETTSKQHLESIKKVAKLEAECRQLKAMARKGTSFSDHRNRESKNSDSLADKISLKPHMISSSNIAVLDDFLEMEKLAAEPVRDVTKIDKRNESGNGDALVKAELEVMINRTAELEEKIEMIETEKGELRMTLTQCQDKIQRSENSLKELKTKFSECQNQLKLSQAELKDANKKMGMLQAELDLAGELRQAIDLELDDANVRREDAESRCKAVENEIENLLSKIAFLEGEVENERAKVSEKCRALEDEFNVKSAVFDAKSVEFSTKSAEFDAKCRKLERELLRTKDEAERWQSQLASVNDLKEVTRELEMAKTKKEEVERQLEGVQGEAKYLLARVSSLELEMDKERRLSMEFSARCKELENELSKLRSVSDVQFAPLSKEELNKQQEKELALAANKLAECQKTIASLGNQLKSLATLEDLFSDSDMKFDISDKVSQPIKTEVQPPSLHSSSSLTVQSDSLSSETSTSNIVSAGLKDGQEFTNNVKQKEELTSLPVNKSQKNGYGKYFPRSKSTVRTRNSWDK